MPRKRKRRIAKLNSQDLKEFVPPGGSFSANAASLAAQSDGSYEQVEVGRDDNSNPRQQETSLPSSMNWNIGTKTKIRVSLRGRSGSTQTASAQQSARQPTHDSEVAQGSREDTVKDDHKAQIDLAVAEGRRLYIGNVAYATTEADLRDFFRDYSIDDLKIPVNPRTSRSVGYAFVTLSSSVEAVRAVEQLNGSLVADRKLSVQLASPGKAKQDPDPKSGQLRKKAKAKQALNHDTGKESSSKPSTNETLVFPDPCTSGTDPVPSADGYRGSETDEHSHSDPIPQLDPFHQPDKFKLPSSGGQPLERRISASRDEDGVLVNIQDESEHESGEITDSRNSTPDSPQHAAYHPFGLDGANSDDESDAEEEGESAEESPENSDAMMDYAKSTVLSGESGYRHPPQVDLAESSRPRTLAQLDQADLELQLRYFHIAKARSQVDLNEPVRCLICTREGHVAANCENMKCKRCGEKNAHSTWNCPLSPVCSRCNEAGHSGLACPSMTKRPYIAAICGMCQRKGHVETDCELRWRTSGGPWESNLEDKRIRFECYECGRSGHLGNDCPTRRPGKPKGSSSWTYHRPPHQTQKARQGISIKGRAQLQQQEPITIDDSGDDEANFHRPKVAAKAGARSGQIRIMAGSGAKSQNQLASNDYRQRDEKFGGRQRSASPRRLDYDVPQTYRRNGDPGIYLPPLEHAPYSFGRPYQQPPLPREPLPYRRSSPPVPVEARRSNAGQTYRPMPSSARQAWRQFRT
ncbi:MAG: hypothetical protein LQ338_001711 [Usnochroma carphineum]|nr:MAG: hypothetical protein LQ338_001711 [Usnochroma carphineum]